MSTSWEKKMAIKAQEKEYSERKKVRRPTKSSCMQPAACARRRGLQRLLLGAEAQHRQMARVVAAAAQPPGPCWHHTAVALLPT